MTIPARRSIHIPGLGLIRPRGPCTDQELQGIDWVTVAPAVEDANAVIPVRLSLSQRHASCFIQATYLLRPPVVLLTLCPTTFSIPSITSRAGKHDLRDQHHIGLNGGIMTWSIPSHPIHPFHADRPFRPPHSSACSSTGDCAWGGWVMMEKISTYNIRMYHPLVGSLIPQAKSGWEEAMPCHSPPPPLPTPPTSSHLIVEQRQYDPYLLSSVWQPEGHRSIDHEGRRMSYKASLSSEVDSTSEQSHYWGLVILPSISPALELSDNGWLLSGWSRPTPSWTSLRYVHAYLLVCTYLINKTCCARKHAYGYCMYRCANSKLGQYGLP